MNLYYIRCSPADRSELLTLGEKLGAVNVEKSESGETTVTASPYWGWTANFIDRLFFWQEGHCADSHRAELERRQAPPSLRSLL